MKIYNFVKMFFIDSTRLQFATKIAKKKGFMNILLNSPCHFFCRNESTPGLVDYLEFIFMQYEKGIINETVYIYIE